MKREIKFEDLPEKMQNDWCKYVGDFEDFNAKILKIKEYYINESRSSYTIYFETNYIVGTANCFIDIFGNASDMIINTLTIGEFKELYNLSSLTKDLRK